jgi:hypothetical protein
MNRDERRLFRPHTLVFSESIRERQLQLPAFGRKPAGRSRYFSERGDVDVRVRADDKIRVIEYVRCVQAQLDGLSFVDSSRFGDLRIESPD